MDSVTRGKRFEHIVLAHLDAAYNLARWLTRDDRDAEDVVQEACLRAFRFLDTFRGGSERAWLLSIVRNTHHSRLKKNRSQALNVPFDEDTIDADDTADSAAIDREEIDRGLEREEARQLLRRALQDLPDEYREVIVLRELEDLSYREIATIAGVPLGTVMSRLSRARKLLLGSLQRIRQEL